MGKKSGAKLYLGDKDFSNQMKKIYKWIIPGFFFGMFFFFLISGGVVPALLFLAVALLYFPGWKDRLAGYHIGGLVKGVLAVLLIIAAVYSTGLYV